MAKDIFSPVEIADSPLPVKKIANQVTAPSFNTITRKIQDAFSFTQLGAIQIGNYANGSTGDIRISPNGIVGRDSSGATTFAIDGTTGNATFKGTISAGSVISATISANNITGQIVNAQIANIDFAKITNVVITTAMITDLSALTITAEQITSGTLTVGGAGKPNAILIRQADKTSDNNLRWSGGSRIWEDNSSNMGLRARQDMFFYVGNYIQRFQFTQSGQNYMWGGLDIQKGADGNGSLNVRGDCRIHEQLRLNYDNLVFSADSGAKVFSVRDMGLTSYRSGSRAGLFWGNNAQFEINSSGSGFYINGTSKSAIVPTSRGYNALYCVEAPEVWFMDFCKADKFVDDMFLEVTEGEMHFIPCDDGGYQVWRRRKGHSEKRFEHKTMEEFAQNEKFLAMAKVVKKW